MSALVIDHALYKAGIGAPVCLTPKRAWMVWAAELAGSGVSQPTATHMCGCVQKKSKKIGDDGAVL